MADYGLIGFFVTLRLLMACLSQTWHVPDETWQSVEIAHRMVFGYGYETWEWTEGIRSYLHPLLFVPGLAWVQALNWDSTRMVILVPRLTQGLVSVIGDLSFVATAQRLASSSDKLQWMVFVYIGNWFVNYCSSRTLVNTLEMNLTSMALYFYAKVLEGRSFSRSTNWSYLILISLSFQIRPTTAILWLPLVLHHCYRVRRRPWKFVSTMVLPAVLTLTLAMGIDSLVYGKWTNVPWNFFQLNVLQDIGSFYGTHPWHWYISQGLPATLTPFIILPFLWSLFQRRLEPLPAKLRPLGMAVTFALIVYSLLPHKEFRFILPLIPILILLIGETRSSTRNPSFVRKAMPALYLLSNVLAVIVLSLLHQRGNMTVMSTVLADPRSVPSGSHVLFLMPCHGTPWQSHLHRSDLELRFLTCDPPLKREPTDAFHPYVDEADEFFRDPKKWLEREIFHSENASTPIPSHLVFFKGLWPEVKALLDKKSFKPCGSFFHSLYFDDSVKINEVWIFCQGE
ncbi:GPI mannosyltransferase 3-like [Tigriopus californicus]|uniref:GPI mannosyltransferase 3-like n=1 Tax=Tigriopus californicus TaxID=6832 RepID=UPI0027DA1668|nr:GPI mannosyltransferase 3-like [Tigriopus californicus]